MEVALLGGSFNPPHLGHQMICLYLLEGEGFQQVWLVPTYKHAFSKKLERFEDRVEMCRLMAEVFSGRVVVSDLESQLPSDHGNRTVDTVDALKMKYPGITFTLAIGSDLLPETSKWNDIERLKHDVDFLVLLRAGHESKPTGWRFAPVVFPKVTSTEIRQALKKGRSVRGLLSGSVRNYIESHRLYRLSE